MPEQKSPVTIVVAPRERFSSITESLESLFSTIPVQVPVVVVEGGSPKEVREGIAAMQQRRPFTHIPVQRLITPQEARNIGLEQVQTEYVVLTDNDIIYEKGWLNAMLRNARERKADVVAPLICIGPPRAEKVHHAGGRLVIHIDDDDNVHVSEQHRLEGASVAALANENLPDTTDVVEFHCFLARMDHLARIGPMDERLITREQVDFALRNKVYGAKVTFERDAIITYMAREEFSESDLRYLAFRWSDPLIAQSLRAFTSTWGIETNIDKVVNTWIRPHRLRAYKSCFKEQAANLSERDFARQAFAAEARLLAPIMPSRKGLSLKVPNEIPVAERTRFYQSIKGSRERNAAWVPPYLRRKNPLVVAGMATSPQRRGTFFEALESILPQVDRLYLFLDRFSSPPSIQHEKIVPLSSQDWGQYGDAGRLLGATMCGVGPVYLGLADDILYPADYVDVMLAQLEAAGPGCVVGVEGTVLQRQGFASFANDRQFAPLNRGLRQLSPVDVLGTDAIAFSTRVLECKIGKWPRHDSPDLSFALHCQREDFSRYAIPREPNWLTRLEDAGADGVSQIKRRLATDDAVDSELAKMLLAATQPAEAAIAS